MKKLNLALVVTVVAGILFGIFFFGNAKKPETAEDNPIISQTGVHWHPEMKIFIKGQQVEIPKNIGLNAVPHNPTHTHEDLPKLHWEIEAGPVRRNQAKLAAFFKAWAQPFSASQILDKQNGSEGVVKMTVNGQPNTEFENYLVKDGDKIEIRFE